ncbi:MAG: hypothetical protein A2Z35_02480 [Actinobacteria bacterium RBG_19FT_COMBO_36_27]|nr:MAG: hypothetical protein A2Z35_02480 [Actinobacteria bacterium RBG_19FT_COMBO_36_27]
MKIEKQQVKVKIKTESTIVRGIVHTLSNGRLSDYITSQKNKFIPVTDAEVFYIDGSGKLLEENISRREIVFINVEKIEMIEYL